MLAYIGCEEENEEEEQVKTEPSPGGEETHNLHQGVRKKT